MDSFTLCGRTVLVVDDLNTMRAIIRSLVTPLKPTAVVEASDGTEALKICRARHIDLIITDLNMAPMNGVEMVRQIRRPENIANSLVPVMMISGHREDANVRAAIDAGVNDFLVKPLIPSDFRQRVENMFTKPRAHITSADYEGPDRRRRAVWVPLDRRATIAV